MNEQFNFNNIRFFKLKKTRRAKDALISFSIIKHKQQKSIKLRLYISNIIIKRFDIVETERIRFGVNKNDPYCWYFILSDSGYLLKKENTKTPSFIPLMPFPFEYVDIKGQSIAVNNIKLYEQERVIEIKVHNIENLKLVELA